MWAVKRNFNNHKEVNVFFNQLLNTTAFISVGKSRIPGTKQIQDFDYLHYPKVNLGTPKAYLAPNYKLVTLEMLKKLLKMEDRKIIGYISPMDLFRGHFKKGTVFVKDEEKSLSMFYKPKGCVDNSMWSMPEDIVETWEPVYEQPPFKVGDWITVTSIDSLSLSHWLRNTKSRTFKIVNEPKQYSGGIMWGVATIFNQYDYGIPKGCFRLATSEEISTAMIVKFDTEIENKEVIITDKLITSSNIFVNEQDIDIVYNQIVIERTIKGLTILPLQVKINCTIFTIEEIKFIYRTHKKLKQLHEAETK